MYRFTLDDETFDEVRDAVDAMIQDTVRVMMEKKNTDGTVTLKLGITMERENIVDPQTGAIREAVLPTFSYSVANVVQTKNSIGGKLDMEREACYDPRAHQWVMRDFGAEQIGFDDEDEE